MDYVNENPFLQLEIRTEVLTHLINRGLIVVADLHALNSHSRDGVRTLLLDSLKSTIER
jgi:hypothetical protein